MINNDNKPDGILVVNGQIFSASDLINIMRRHGIRIGMNREGLIIDGEQVVSISNLDDNKCPLAGTCEKRVALVEFLKLQKTQEIRSSQYEEERLNYSEASLFYDNHENQNNDFRREEPRNDFIKPNNHDLFEGNISNQYGLFDEPPVVRDRGLFDEPPLFSEPEENQFEDSLYQESNDFEQKPNQNEDYYQEKRQFNQHESQQPFCSECGFDLKSSWISCPNCGNRVIRKAISKEKNYFF
ncbi:MAG: hypothetical protein EAX90_00990 [Candidatus Heimdallarchaeota archaeon]|nr:hypothetical protein [Candidatus Heimdallarchaeota archaeon]